MWKNTNTLDWNGFSVFKKKVATENGVFTYEQPEGSSTILPLGLFNVNAKLPTTAFVIFPSNSHIRIIISSLEVNNTIFSKNPQLGMFINLPSSHRFFW